MKDSSTNHIDLAFKESNRKDCLITFLINHLLRLVIISVFMLSSIITVSAKGIKISKHKTTLSQFNETNFTLLRNIHLEAIEKKLNIDYNGVDTIRLIIPSDAQSIPLPRNINFKNVVILVRNNCKNIFLFRHIEELTPIKIDKNLIGNTNYISSKEFENKKILLVVKDLKPWVKERVGFNYPHIRQDLLLIDNCKLQNEPIQPYDNEYSNPECLFREIKGNDLIVRDLKVIRTEDSTFKTYCLEVKNSEGIRILNISVMTPPSHLYGDNIFNFDNCANLTMSNIKIEGTYSQKDRYGYGILMNNVLKSTFNKLIASGNWGVFGTNNVNSVQLYACDINRFDIHCYGKDVFCKNSVFRNLYNQFGSFYGTLSYDNCEFLDFVPVANWGSYSAFTTFNVYLNNCKIRATAKSTMLCNMSYSKLLIEEIRPELQKITWPNIYLKNVDISCVANQKDYYIYHTFNKDHVILDTDFSIGINNLNMNFSKLILSNSDVQVKSVNYPYPTILIDSICVKQ